jgi:ornithine decarboxylase
MWLESGREPGRVVHGSSVLDLLQRMQPSEPVFCLDQAFLARRAQAIVASFDGDLCHDVAVNPHPLILATLAQAGVRRFAVSRVEDLAILDRLAPAVVPVLRQPVNSRRNLRTAAERHRVRVFAVAHVDELAKLHEEVGAGVCEVEIRASLSAIKNAGGSADGSLAPVERMVRTAIEFGFRPSIAIHPGVSSAVHITEAIAYCRSLTQRSGVLLEAINLGSADVSADGESVEGLCAAARAQATRLGFGATRLRLDASRAMVNPCCSIVAQVLLRKSDAIYLSDGRFGWLHSLDRRLRGNAAAPILRRLRGRPSQASHRFHVFGPTCDSYDAFETPIMLPADVGEGDWIEFPAMGADTIAWACAFNGLHPSLFAVVGPLRASDRRAHAPTSSAVPTPVAWETLT